MKIDQTACKKHISVRPAIFVSFPVLSLILRVRDALAVFLCSFLQGIRPRPWPENLQLLLRAPKTALARQKPKLHKRNRKMIKMLTRV
jgi:hypothetical protein